MAILTLTLTQNLKIIITAQFERHSTVYFLFPDSPEFFMHCPQCSESFESVSALRDHLQSAHDVDPAEMPDLLVAQAELNGTAGGQVVSVCGRGELRTMFT